MGQTVKPIFGPIGNIEMFQISGANLAAFQIAFDNIVESFPSWEVIDIQVQVVWRTTAPISFVYHGFIFFRK